MSLTNERHHQLPSWSGAQTRYHHPDLQDLFGCRRKRNINSVPVCKATYLIITPCSSISLCLNWGNYLFTWHILWDYWLKKEHSQEFYLAWCCIFDKSSVHHCWLWHWEKSKLSTQILAGLLTASNVQALENTIKVIPNIEINIFHFLMLPNVFT